MKATSAVGMDYDDEDEYGEVPSSSVKSRSEANDAVESKWVTHAGVLEFIADEGKVYLPQWMMKNLVG